MKFHDMKTIRLVFGVMVLADKYMINELKEICDSLLQESAIITEDNVFDLVFLVDSNNRFTAIRREIRRKCAEYLKVNIGLHGYRFIQKLNNQPSFNHEIFKELCDPDEPEVEKNEDEVVELLDETDALNSSDSVANSSCSVS